jgi:hypothetical protein
LWGAVHETHNEGRRHGSTWHAESIGPVLLMVFNPPGQTFFPGAPRNDSWRNRTGGQPTVKNAQLCLLEPESASVCSQGFPHVETIYKYTVDGSLVGTQRDRTRSLHSCRSDHSPHMPAIPGSFRLPYCWVAVFAYMYVGLLQNHAPSGAHLTFTQQLVSEPSIWGFLWWTFSFLIAPVPQQLNMRYPSLCNVFKQHGNQLHRP